MQAALLRLSRFAVPPHRRFPQFLGPRSQPLGRPDVVEQLGGREGLKIGFGQPACQLSSGWLCSKGNAFLLPLDILRGPASDQLAEEEVDHPRAHGLHQSPRLARTAAVRRGPLGGSCGWKFRKLLRLEWGLHSLILFEHIFEHKGGFE
jgi:hypothetical protein